MANDYTRSEVLNEIARIFRARIDPGKEGGTLNTQVEYEQLLELASFTFLINPTSIYYLARIVANQLTAKVRREAALAEDILVLLENLANVGAPVRDSTELYNARTALLALDAASQRTGRPESQNFRRSMDRYAEFLRKNVQDLRTQQLTRPREDARELIRDNLAKMKTVHASLLTSVEGLRDLLEDYIALNLPDKVATLAFSRVRDRIDQIITNTEDTSNTDNIAASRSSLLSVLASQVAVDLVSEFRDPREMKFRSPNRPIPSTITHLGEVVGDGTPATVVTNSGPWTFPISAPLELSVDGGPAQEISLELLTNASISGESTSPFNIKQGHQNLHVIVDPNTYKLTVGTGSTNSHAVLDQPTLVEDRFTWGFKHLGNTVLFRNAVLGTSPGETGDTYPRVISEFGILTTVDILDFDSDSGILTISAGTFLPEYIGAYLKIGAYRYEILDYLTSTTIITETRGQNGGADPTGSGIEVRGQLSTDDDIQFDFIPVLAFGDPQSGDAVEAGPCMKTFQTPIVGAITAAALVAELNQDSALGDYDALHLWAGLKDHVKATLTPNNPESISLAPRSRLDSYLQVVGLFPKPILTPAAGPMELLEGSCHDRIGISLGATIESEFDTNNLLSPDELADVVKDVVTGVDVTTEVVTLYAGSTLQKIKETKNVVDISGVNFITLGVEVGDIVQILGGTEPGSFQVEQVQASNLFLAKANDFVSTQEGLDYRIVRSRVRFTSQTDGPGSSIQVTGPEEMGISETIQPGSISTFRAVNEKGDSLSFTGVTPGDLLRIVGKPQEYEIEKNLGTSLTLKSGLSSSLVGAGFEIKGGGSKSYETLQAALTTFLSSQSLFAKNGFNENLDALDAAITSAVLPGQDFAASRNRARRVTSELLTLLTDSPRRADEYTLYAPSAAVALEQLLQTYSAPKVYALDRLIDAFEERRYDRAADLIKAGKFVDFFNTTEESGSYAGAIMVTSRAVNNDLPLVSTAQEDIDDIQNIATGTLEVPDADIEFDDIEGEYEIDA